MTGCVEVTQLLACLLPGHPRHRLHHVLAVGGGGAGAGLAAHGAVPGAAHGVAVGSVRLLRVRAGEQQAPILRGEYVITKHFSFPLLHFSTSTDLCYLYRKFCLIAVGPSPCVTIFLVL